MQRGFTTVSCCVLVVLSCLLPVAGLAAEAPWRDECVSGSYRTNVATPVIRAGRLYFDPRTQRWSALDEAEGTRVVATPRRNVSSKSSAMDRVQWVNVESGREAPYYRVQCRDSRAQPVVISPLE